MFFLGGRPVGFNICYQTLFNFVGMLGFISRVLRVFESSFIGYFFFFLGGGGGDYLVLVIFCQYYCYYYYYYYYCYYYLYF